MKTAVLNIAALLGALAVAVMIVPWGNHESSSATEKTSDRFGDGVLVDASGQRFEPRHYQRIASASPVADELLLELCSPDRIVAFTGYSQRGERNGFRYEGKGTIERITDVEAILALDPDLALVHSLIDPRHVERLREAGIPVFDLGAIEGVPSLWDDIDTLARLLGHPQRGKDLKARLRADLEAIARNVPLNERKRGLYATVVGNRVYGGTTGSSYHDVLTYAGLEDVAAGEYRQWPAYSPEQLLALDPPLIVTATGVGEQLCGLSALGRLQACADGRAGIIEIEPELLSSGALGIVDAARAVHAEVYPEH